MVVVRDDGERIEGGDNPDSIRRAAERCGLDPAPFKAQWERLYAERMAARKAAGIDDESLDAARERFLEARDKLARTSATTLEGLAVKVRELADQVDDGRLDGEHNYETLLGRGICADMDRLIG